jgi:lipopolysaccharide export system protein LptC
MGKLTAAFKEGIDRPQDGSRRAKQFVLAKRHSARVRLLKRIMIIGSFAAIAVVLVIGVFDPFHHMGSVLSVDALAINGSKVTMEKPHLAGFRQDGRPYRMDAEAMVQDLQKPTAFSLIKVDGTIGMADKSSAKITADTGSYDNTANAMDLKGNVRIHNDAGYEALMSSAHIDFKSNAFRSDQPVKVFMNTTTVTADALKVADNGKTVVFIGHVKSIMIPQKEATRTTADLKSTTP